MALIFEIPLLLSIFFGLTSALPTPQNGDGGGGSPPAGGLGYDPSAVGGNNNAGSSGQDSGSVNLSNGATIAISVVAGLVVIVGIVTAVLFFVSKKRQWNLRDRARASVKRVGTGLREVMTPRTPHKMTFSPVLKQRSDSDANLLKNPARAPSSSPPHRGRELEKGNFEPTKTYTVTSTGPASAETHSRNQSESRSASHTRGLSLNTKDLGPQGGRTGQKIKEKKPLPAPVSVPQSKFEMDSPKTPFLSRFVFGRR